MRRILFVDCFAGASGDMFLGALLDLGVPRAVIDAEIAKLALDGVAIRAGKEARHGIAGTKVHVDLHGDEVLEGQGIDSAREAGALLGYKIVGGIAWRGHGVRLTQHDHDHAHDHPHDHSHGDHAHDHAHGDHAHSHGATRRYVDIDTQLAAAGLSPATLAIARRAFRLLGEAESHVHGIALAEVRLHEVGAVDALVDIVGTAAGIAHLAADEIVVARVPLGRGMTRGSHGAIPLPAPATLHLLRDAPVYGLDEDGETVTPTGAALLCAIAHRFGPLPAMRVAQVGHGVGARNPQTRPNLLRLMVGDADGAPALERLVVIEANIDDMNPEIFEHLVGLLFEHDARDVWLAPVQMKKGRPAVVLSVLCEPARRDELAALVLRESTSLGVRYHDVERRALARTVREVSTPWGTVRVKVGEEEGRMVNAAPEYEDCRRIARAAGVPLKVVYQTALAAMAQLPAPAAPQAEPPR